MPDTKITDLTSVTASSGDEIYVNKAGADRKVTAESIGNLAKVITLSSGTGTVTPLRMTPGTLNTTSTAGAVEFDGDCYYATAQTSARQVVITEQIITQLTSYVGTTALTAQKAFNATTNGTLIVGPNKSYMFDALLDIRGRSTASNTVSFSFAGTAALDRLNWTSLSLSAAATSVAGAATFMRSQGAGNVITVANTLNQLAANIQGKVVIGTSGTLIPSISRSAGTVALVVEKDSYFRIWPIGSTSVETIGNWT
jgi:hypothetical protein